ncbi:MAG: polysaccharide deacetylase family protein [Flavobacteriales bacterium]|nr:polysaccharide deacetylase family protein [Flavobacteriales bacterium]
MLLPDNVYHLASALFPQATWHGNRKENVLYLSFDDGPCSVATPFVLEILRTFDAKGSFFMLGNRVEVHPNLMQFILAEGHCVGNHGYNHISGWRTNTRSYLENIEKASALIASALFRPPYGRLRYTQYKRISSQYHIIMWDVLSGDYISQRTATQCLEHIVSQSRPGSIIVFHDTARCMSILRQLLPAVLEYYQKQDYQFLPLSEAVFGNNEKKL